MNPFSRLRTEHLILIASLTAVFATGLVLAQRPRGLGYDPANERQGSTHYSTPLGTKAFYTLLDRVGAHPFRQDRMLSLTPEAAGMLLVLAPSRDLDPSEVEWLREWVVRGGRLVVCPRRGAPASPVPPLLAAFNLELAPRGTDAAVDLPATLEPLGGAEGRSYTISAGGPLRLRPAPAERRARALAQDEQGWVAGVVYRGTGRVVAIADPDLLSNGGISRGDNVEFAVRLAELLSAGRSIGFDEYHHGFVQGQSFLSILWGSPLRPALFLAVAAAFCGVFASGRRLGPPADPHEERRRRPAEFIEAFAGLCRRMGAAPQALSMVVAEFRLYLQEAGGDATPQSLERMARRAGLDPAGVTAALERASRQSMLSSLADAPFVSSCRQLEAIREAFRKPSMTRKTP